MHSARCRTSCGLKRCSSPFGRHIHCLPPREGWRGPHHVGKMRCGVMPRIQVHAGKTKVWNRAGVRPEHCDFLERRAHLAVERARVWRGGLRQNAASKSWGHLEHPEFVEHQLQAVRQHQQIFLDRIPSIPDVQSAWALLLANYFIRVVPPDDSHSFAVAHDNVLWRCFCAVLRVGRVVFGDRSGRSFIASHFRWHWPPQCRPHCDSGLLGQLGGTLQR